MERVSGRLFAGGHCLYVGNVVNNAGYYYSVQNGGVGDLGYAGWNHCRGGGLLATRFEPNGYWVCME